MKEAIEELIETYMRRIKNLESMILASSTETTRLRLVSKKSVYKTVVADLNYLLREDGD